ncbi:hypothetical protein GC194_03365 [bacterium]|nr:hypothetical protein [bacterium]
MSVKPVRTKFKKINYQVGTNFLIISHKRFKTSVDAYANYKQSAPGGSFTTTVVYIDDLFRNYLYGYHHPVAIKNFLRSLIVDGKKPQNVMFIGKAVNLSYLRTPDGVIDYSKDLVPSIGSPCSDWYYGRYLTPTQFTSPFAIGRLSATQNIEIANYLDKLKAYNALTDNKWRKDVLHVSGGKSGTELIRFRNYMAQFGRLIEGPKPGANVYYFGKETGLEIDVNLTDEIIARANQGIGLFSYFGHAGANVTEVDLATPVRYNNANTPMVMMFGGCVLGGCYEDVNSLGEDFITAKTGAVAWVANSAFSFESMVFEYTMEFYREMAGTEYGKSIGELQRSTIEHYILEGNAYNESQCWNTQLQGDPSIVLYSPDKPDYEITNSNIFITPDNVTAQTDSFDFNLIIRNNGLAIADSLITTYKLTYPNGSVTSDTLRLFKVYNSDTFTFNFRNKSRLFGEYKVEVNLDPDNIVQEIRENNNSATYTFILVSNGSAGLYPPDYGIVSSSDVELVAQSLDLNAKNNDFQFELDTTPNFKSPWRKQSGNVRSNLVGSWKVNLLAKDSQDYYWRVRIKLKNGSYSPWTSKSFSYISNSLDGWAQLDFKQLKNSHLTNIYSDTSIRSFRFYRFTAPGQFIIQNHGRDYPPGQHYDFGTRITWVDEKLLRNNQYGLIDGNNSLNGMVVYAFNPNINENDLFDPWIKDFGVYQNKNGETRFDWMKTETEIDPVILDSFISYVNQVPKGYHVLMYSGYYHRIADMPERFYKAIESLGSSQIRKVKNNGVWLLAGTKGYAPGEAEDEQYTTQQDSLLQSSVSFTVIKSDGVYASSVIGPSKKWRLLQIASKDFKSNNAGVNNYYNLLGIDREGNKLVLVDNFKAQNLDLSFIDAEKYPYLQLELRTKNTNDFIPAKPQTWVVSYDYLPEGLINTQLAYKFDRDSVQQGELLNFEIGYQNVSKLSLENVVVTYEIQNNNRESKFFETDTIKPLGPGESTILRKTFNSNNLLNANKLIVKTNPNFKVPELYSFNNNFQHDFYVEGDFELPLMEVTFDGARILDGDIVSPEPEIVISGKDNNNYFLIDKPEYFEIYLLNNNTGTNQKIESTTDGFTFYPATVKNRTAKIRFNPARLADGKYSLSVQLSDASGNTSGKTAYTVNFEVVGASTITNFYPYPNPFSTEMKFVFTLTGSQIPDDIVIQIFTVSGKLVREITKGELGHLKIGQNVSTFAWNGTDMFGNRLANGVYLYRVKTVINGKQVEHRATSKDNAFKDSYGKIYILR